MKILSIGNFGHGWDGSICDEEHIAKGLEARGHEVIRQQRGHRLYGKFRYLDFILLAQWDGYDDIFLAGLKKLFGVPIVYWAFDHQAQDQEWHVKLIGASDLYLSKRLADFVFGPKWHWLSQDFYPDFLRPHLGMDKDIDVLFTGTYLDWAHQRNETLKAIDDNFNLQIHSVNPDAWIIAGFKNAAGPVMDQALGQLIGRTKINISIDHTIEAGYWSDRTAQIMACAGFTLMRYVPLAEARFMEGVQFFHNTGEALMLIEESLNNPQLRLGLGTTARDYAESFLAAQNRVDDLLTIVKDTVL